MDRICALLYRWLCLVVVHPLKQSFHADICMSVYSARTLHSARNKVSRRMQCKTTLAGVTLPRRAASMKCSCDSAKLCKAVLDAAQRLHWEHWAHCTEVSSHQCPLLGDVCTICRQNIATTAHPSHKALNQWFVWQSIICSRVISLKLKPTKADVPKNYEQILIKYHV